MVKLKEKKTGKKNGCSVERLCPPLILCQKNNKETNPHKRRKNSGKCDLDLKNLAPSYPCCHKNIIGKFDEEIQCIKKRQLWATLNFRDRWKDGQSDAPMNKWIPMNRLFFERAKKNDLFCVVIKIMYFFQLQLYF